MCALPRGTVSPRFADQVLVAMSQPAKGRTSLSEGELLQDELISVLMPVRNGQSTVQAALDDILIAMSRDDELLVIDDGSEDSTPGLLVDLAAQDSRVRIITTQGLGLVSALNLGLREARHHWVARADADDRYPPDRLQNQRHALRKGIALVTGDYRIGSIRAPLGEIPCALTPPFVVASLIHPQRVPHPGVIVNRIAVHAAGGYREEEFPAEDLGLWLRLASEGDFVGVPAPVLRWSMSSGSVTHAMQAPQRRKTKQLIATEFPLRSTLSINVEDVERELLAYEGTRLEPVRRLLLYRDLRALISRGGSKGAAAVARDALLRSPRETIGAGGRLAFDKWRRDRLRGGFGFRD